jgi:hypothetical protein
VKAQVAIEQETPLLEPCTTSRGHSERCLNPVCEQQVEPIENGWRRTERFYCGDVCRQQASIIRRAAKLIEGLSDQEALKIMRAKL